MDAGENIWGKLMRDCIVTTLISVNHIVKCHPIYFMHKKYIQCSIFSTINTLIFFLLTIYRKFTFFQTLYVAVHWALHASSLPQLWVEISWVKLSASGEGEPGEPDEQQATGTGARPTGRLLIKTYEYTVYCLEWVLPCSHKFRNLNVDKSAIPHEKWPCVFFLLKNFNYQKTDRYHPSVFWITNMYLSFAK